MMRNRAIVGGVSAQYSPAGDDVVCCRGRMTTYEACGYRRLLSIARAVALRITR
jgi:hypothetical protein